ncbi:hypothetical protein [Bacteroides gallinarum]|nr:hypothetical protein [Bacteroides gallinarum]
MVRIVPSRKVDLSVPWDRFIRLMGWIYSSREADSFIPQDKSKALKRETN